MFAKPRIKKSPLPPPIKKRKTEHSIEEISFDLDARQEYLTGFRKRKLQRIKRAQEEADRRAREERIEMRKQLREDRQREVEEHVQKVNAMLRESEAAGAIVNDSDSEGSEWGGIEDPVEPEIIDHEEEYIDEDRYTTVTVESVSVTRDGFHKPKLESSEDEDDEEAKAKKEAEEKAANEKKKPPKVPKKKFRYETKIERQLTQQKQKAKKRAKINR